MLSQKFKVHGGKFSLFQEATTCTLKYSDNYVTNLQVVQCVVHARFVPFNVVQKIHNVIRELIVNSRTLLKHKEMLLLGYISLLKNRTANWGI